MTTRRDFIKGLLALGAALPVLREIAPRVRDLEVATSYVDVTATVTIELPPASRMGPGTLIVRGCDPNGVPIEDHIIVIKPSPGDTFSKDTYSIKKWYESVTLKFDLDDDNEGRWVEVPDDG